MTRYLIKNIKIFLFFFIVVLINSCVENTKKNTKISENQKSLLIHSEEDTINDSIYLAHTNIFYNKFLDQIKLGVPSDSSRLIIDSLFTNYRKVVNKDSKYAYDIYKNTWDFYIDHFEHSTAIAFLEEFITISNKDDKRSTIQLLEAYSYLGGELAYSGQCEKAIEKCYNPFLELLEQISQTKDPDEINMLRKGKLAIYSYYLQCAGILGDGKLQKKILDVSEKLVVEEHDHIPSYNLYKADLLGLMSSRYVEMGDLGKAKIFLELYEQFMEPQDVIDDIFMSSRKMRFFSLTNDIEQFNVEFEISGNKHAEALKQFPSNTEEYFLALGHRKSAYQQKAMLYAKKNPVDTRIPILYYKAITSINHVEYDSHLNPLGVFSGLITYYDSTKQKDSVSFYLEKYSTLAKELNDINSTRNAQIFYLEHFLKEKKYKSVDSLITKHLDALNIKNIQSSLSQENILESVIANEKTIGRLLKIANLLQEYSKDNTQHYLKKSNQFYLLAASLLNALKQSQWFNPKEIKQLEEINAGILSTRTASLKNDDIIIKYLEGNQSLELLQKNANKNIDLQENEDLGKLISERRKLSTKISKLTSQYLKNEIEPVITDKGMYVQLLHQKDSLNKKIKKEYPEYVFYTSPNFDLNSYRAGLQDDTITIRFYLTETNCYSYLISKNIVKYISLGSRNTLNDLITTFRRQIKTRENISNTIASINKVFKPLFSEINSYNNFKIIPHKELGYLPFEIIFNDFLTSNKVLSYNASLILDGNKQNYNTKTSFAAYAPKYSYNDSLAYNKAVVNLERSGNYELPEAYEEAAYVSKLFKGRFFVNNEATKQHFIAHANEYSILHLAMHAIMNDSENEKDAMLLFSGNKEEDYLNLNDIYNLQLSTDLTTLSACNTGYGKIDPVEGVMSLSRAFQYAGSKATVTSLWKVPDKATSIIMKQFYNNLKDGNSKSEALKNAKLNYINITDDDNLKHPYYWAGFVLTGDVSPIVISTNYWAYALVILGLLAIYLLVRSRRLKSKL